jgi:hypothetical protein
LVPVGEVALPKTPRPSALALWNQPPKLKPVGEVAEPETARAEDALLVEEKVPPNTLPLTLIWPVCLMPGLLACRLTGGSTRIMPAAAIEVVIARRKSLFTETSPRAWKRSR